MSKEMREWLEVFAGIFLRCWAFGFLLLFLWLGIFTLVPQVIYSVHGHLFDLSPHELNLIHYGAMAFVKLTVICFFFFPWAAIRLMLRKPAE